MAVIRGGIDKKYLELYKGFGEQEAGPGTNPDIFASQAFARRKIQTLYIGGLSSFIYAGAFVDDKPLGLIFRHEPQFNTVLGFNLNYLPIKLRKDVLRFVLESNQNRIKSQQQIIVSFDAVSRAVPEARNVVRRYKLQLMNVRETHPLVDFGEVVENSGTRFSNVFRENVS